MILDRSPVLLALLPLLALCGCNGDPPPAWCEAKEPLTLDCGDSECLVAVMVDYVRLEPRGYLVRPLTQNTPVDVHRAEALATEHVTKILGADPPDLVDSDRAGDFFNCFLTYQTDHGTYQANDNWLVIIHAYSGEVVFAGLEIWANPDRGHDFGLPPGWRGPAPLGCTDNVSEPAEKALRTTGIPMGTAAASTPEEAWQIARRLNLTEQFTSDEPFEVMVVSYSPATGEFDPRSADWLVWLVHGN